MCGEAFKYMHTNETDPVMLTIVTGLYKVYMVNSVLNLGYEL